MKTVGILGYGTMGTAIVKSCVKAGYPVVWWGRDIEKLHLAMKKVKGHITPTEDLGMLRDVDILIEAVIEDKKVKRELFLELDKICGRKTAFCSNTSCIPISYLSSRLRHSKRFIGMHFFPPVSEIPVVEVVKGKVGPAEIKEIKEFAKSLGKGIVIVKDVPGFVANRLIFPSLNEAVVLLEKKAATKEEIDKLMLGIGYPIGPFKALDMIGIDVAVDVLKAMYTLTRDKKYKPAKMLLSMVRKGLLGVKVGKGFY